jgi:hypothetical protein
VLLICSIGKQTFVLKNPDDKETLQSSERYRARLLGTAHLSSRDSPSCLTFAYQVTGDKSNKLSVSVKNLTIWRHRFLQGQRFGKVLNLFEEKKALYVFSLTQMQLNISSSLTGSSRTATIIAFDGQLKNNNAQIQLENILITHQPCSSRKTYFVK